MKIANILAAVLLSAVPVVAGATRLIDGSFERKGTATNVTAYCYDSSASNGGARCAASAWVGGGVVANGDASWGATSTGAGIYYAFIQEGRTLSQSFVANSDRVATLSWSDSNRSNNGGQQAYSVSIFDGTSTTDLGVFTSAAGEFASRVSSSFTLIDGTSYTLKFTGQFTDDRTSFIDNVALNFAAVPEPATWSMLLIGFGLVGFAARRRQAVVAA